MVEEVGATEATVEGEAKGPIPGAVAGELSPVEKQALENTTAVSSKATIRAGILVIRRSDTPLSSSGHIAVPTSEMDNQITDPVATTIAES